MAVNSITVQDVIDMIEKQCHAKKPTQKYCLVLTDADWDYARVLDPTLPEQMPERMFGVELVKQELIDDGS